MCFVDHRLPESADAVGKLQSHRAGGKQRTRGAPDVLQRERRVSGQDDVGDALGEAAVPARRARGVGCDERMRDHLGGDEGKGHDAAEEVVDGLDAPATRDLHADDRIVRNHVAELRRLAGAGRIDVAVETTADQPRELACDGDLRDEFMLACPRPAAQERQPCVPGERNATGGTRVDLHDAAILRSPRWPARRCERRACVECDPEPTNTR